MNTNEWNCYVSGQAFRGGCPIQRCWANIKSSMHPSRCIYLMLNKRDINEADLSYAWGKSLDSIQQQIDRGRSQLAALHAYLEALDDLRSGRSLQGCSKCGFHQAAHSPINCQNRRTLLVDFLNHRPFRDLDNPPTPLEFSTLLTSVKYQDLLKTALRLDDTNLERLVQLVPTCVPDLED